METRNRWLWMLAALAVAILGGTATADESPEEPPKPKAAFAWQADVYIPPSADMYFPDDPDGAVALSSLFQDREHTELSDTEILDIVRRGYRRSDLRSLYVLRWIGNRYIWGRDPQNPVAVELMYHATGLDEHNAVYFGLSPLKEKTPNVLRTMADLCMRGSEVGRITWGLGGSNQREDIIPYFEDHLDDPDPEKREIAERLIAHFRGEGNFEQWWGEKLLAARRAEFGDQLPALREKLLTGSSEERWETLKSISGNQLLGILDESFLPAYIAAGKDEDTRVRNEVARQAGNIYVWGAKGERRPDAIRLMLDLSRDEDRQVRYSAVYFGLSTVRGGNEEVGQRLIEMALEDHEPNNYGRVIWGLTHSFGESAEFFEKTLAEYAATPSSDVFRDASLFYLYRDLMKKDPPPEWGLTMAAGVYPMDLFLVSVEPRRQSQVRDSDALWADFRENLPSSARVELLRTEESDAGDRIIVKISGEESRFLVERTAGSDPDFVLGQLVPFPPQVQLFYEEAYGLKPAQPETSAVP